MHFARPPTWTLALLATITPIHALPEPQPQSTTSIFSSTAPFSSSTLTTSFGGSALCLTGKIPITASSNNTKIHYSIPDQRNATATVQSFFSPYTTIYNTTNGGPSLLTGTFAIHAKLCVPKTLSRDTDTIPTLQVLTHGATLDNTYWDFAPNYSYIDDAAKAGYATLSYDRLGIGGSDHPDPIQIVQANLQRAILHQLVTLLRTSSFGGHRFAKIVGVGHSAGSVDVLGVTAQYPKDYDAVILTGITADWSMLPAALMAAGLEIANQGVFKDRFRGLQNGYLSPSSPVWLPGTLYRYPYFDQSIADRQFAGVQTIPVGETFTLNNSLAPAPAYTNPVLMMTGVHDFIMCGDNCELPSDQTKRALEFFFPGVKGEKGSTFLVPETGHNIEQHFNVGLAHEKAWEFLKGQGF